MALPCDDARSWAAPHEVALACDDARTWFGNGCTVSPDVGVCSVGGGLFGFLPRRVLLWGFGSGGAARTCPHSPQCCDMSAESARRGDVARGDAGTPAGSNDNPAIKLNTDVGRYTTAETGPSGATDRQTGLELVFRNLPSWEPACDIDDCASRTVCPNVTYRNAIVEMKRSPRRATMSGSRLRCPRYRTVALKPMSR